MFPDFFTPAPTQLFFPKPLTTFLTCLRVEGQKIIGKKEMPQPGNTRSSVRYTSYWAIGSAWLLNIFSWYLYALTEYLTLSVPNE